MLVYKAVQLIFFETSIVLCMVISSQFAREAGISNDLMLIVILIIMF